VCTGAGSTVTVAGTCSIPSGPLAGTPVYMYDEADNNITTIK
jgi:hypothetical protein